MYTRDLILRAKMTHGIVQGQGTKQINRQVTLTKWTEEMGENQYPSMARCVTNTVNKSGTL